MPFLFRVHKKQTNFFQIYFLTLFCTEKLKSMNEAFREVKNKEKGRELAWCESLQLERVLLLIIYNNYSDLYSIRWGKGKGGEGA